MPKDDRIDEEQPDPFKTGIGGFGRVRPGGKVHFFYKWVQDSMCHCVVKHNTLGPGLADDIPSKADGCKICLKLLGVG